MPDWYLAEPPVLEGEDVYFINEAYAELSTERRYSGGPIPRSASMLYARESGLAYDVAILLWRAIRRIDEAELNWFAKSHQQGQGDDGERLSD